MNNLHDSFDCPTCGIVWHDPADPFDTSHCECMLMPAKEALDCACPCHNPCTLADVL